MTTDTLTRTDFLLARLAEDEADATGGPWHVDLGDFERILDDTDVYVADVMGPNLARQIARFDPARVHAECEAKRFVVTHYLEAKRMRDEVGPTGTIEQARAYMTMQTVVMALGPLVAKFAAIYSDHPDYRPEWRG